MDENLTVVGVDYEDGHLIIILLSDGTSIALTLAEILSVHATRLPN